MGPEDIFKKCMHGSLNRLVKGGLVYQYFRSPFFVWCNAFGLKEEKDPESAYMNMIFEYGRNHEDEVCDEIYPGGISIDPTLHEKAFVQALEGLFAGEKYIKNGIFYFLPESLVAVPDVLELKPGPSLFGDFHYEVVEIKSSGQIREEHIMQAAYYNYIISIIQGMTPEKFVLVNGQKEKTEFLYSDYEKKVIDTIREIKEIFKGKQPIPERVGWPWESFSLKKLKEMKSISLVPNLYSSHKKLLHNAGVQTLDDFFNLNILRVDGMRSETLEKYRKSAKAILQGKHSFIEKPFLPEGKTEIFMDFEGVQCVRFNGKKVSGDYLIGMLVREDGKERYIHFVSESLENEHEILLDFLKFLRDRDDYIIYHYGSYEKAHLAKMINKYGIDEGMAEKVIGSMVDILQVAKNSVVFPTHSYSLKQVAGYLGFSWKDLGNAKDSIALYLEFLESGNRQVLDKIITYNHDDCIALKRVKDFLVWGT